MSIGRQKLKKFVDDLWKKIAEWFKKNIKIFNRVKWMSSGFFKFGDDGNTFRNFLKLRERNNDGYNNILCHGDPKSAVVYLKTKDKILKVLRFRGEFSSKEKQDFGDYAYANEIEYFIH